MLAGRMLGVDVGSVRIGIAVSDPMGIFAQPLEVIDRRKVDGMARLLELVANYEVERIVVGRPTRLTGADGPAVEAVEAFATALRARVDIPVDLWDERMTTAQAQRTMIAQNVRRETRRQSIDKVAAALILQSFMDAPSTS